MDKDNGVMIAGREEGNTIIMEIYTLIMKNFILRKFYLPSHYKNKTTFLDSRKHTGADSKEHSHKLDST